MAALNMNWPGSKLNINILDDGKRPEMARLVRRLAFQCKYMQVWRRSCSCYCGWARPMQQCPGLASSAQFSVGRGQLSRLAVLRSTSGCSPFVPVCTLPQREANITYIGRDKAKGVPHHAKAGNINSCLLKEGKGRVRVRASSSSCQVSASICWLISTRLRRLCVLVSGCETDFPPHRVLCWLRVQGEFILVLDCDMSE